MRNPARVLPEILLPVYRGREIPGLRGRAFYSDYCEGYLLAADGTIYRIAA